MMTYCDLGLSCSLYNTATPKWKGGHGLSRPTLNIFLSMDILFLGIFKLWERALVELYTVWVQMVFSPTEDNDQVSIWKLFLKFIIYSGLNVSNWVTLMINFATGWYSVGK